MLSMELQLGLALPIIHSPAMVKGLDLNCLRFETDSTDHQDVWDQSECGRVKSKRGFEEAFGKIGERRCSSPPPRKNSVADLLVWHGQPNDGNGHKKMDDCPINKIDEEEENYIIGWPPIKSSRKKQLLQSHATWRHRNVHAGAGEMIRTRSTAQIKLNRSSSSSSSSSSSLSKNNSVYVKVKMEGVAIARKVDLSLHRSYHTLKNTLLSMFSNDDQECIEERYTLTYQDKEGDWLLAGDVPWKSFVKSVQRLEIVRN